MKRKKSVSIDTASANFRNFVVTLSDRIGQHQIPVVRDAMHPNALISSEAVHYDLVKRIFRDIYRANHCYHLNASVSCHTTFDALGKVHAQLIDSDKTDIDQIGLLREIGEAAREFFEQHETDTPVPAAQKKSASITSFGQYSS